MYRVLHQRSSENGFNSIYLLSLTWYKISFWINFLIIRLFIITTVLVGHTSIFQTLSITRNWFKSPRFYWKLKCFRATLDCVLFGLNTITLYCGTLVAILLSKESVHYIMAHYVIINTKPIRLYLWYTYSFEL